MVINDFEPEGATATDTVTLTATATAMDTATSTDTAPYTNSDGYYSDEDEPKPTWKERIKRLF